jgi:membrane-bound ClpP family serine protease
VIEAICALNLLSFVENIGTVQTVLFILGLALLVAEMFMPGFGIAGGCGVILIAAGIIMTARTPFEAFVMISILILLVILLLVIILRSAKKGKLSKKLILRSAATREEGFSATGESASLIGKEGLAVTQLRPSGTGVFDGQRFDVVSEGIFIEPGTKIKIVHTEGRRIVVRPAE